MNQFNCVGRLGGDPETRYTAAGKAVTEFSVAFDQGFGQSKKTSWVRCAMFGERGEKIGQMVRKGERIGITGSIYTEEFERRDGSKGFSLKCYVSDVTLLGDAQNAGGQGATPARAAGAPEPRSAAAPPASEQDDIPF